MTARGAGGGGRGGAPEGGTMERIVLAEQLAGITGPWQTKKWRCSCSNQPVSGTPATWSTQR